MILQIGGKKYLPIKTYLVIKRLKVVKSLNPIKNDESETFSEISGHSNKEKESSTITH